MKRWVVLLAALAIALGGCSGDDPNAGAWPIAPAPVSVDEIAWNPSRFDVGAVNAVTEDGDDVIVFGDKGAAVFSGGAIAAVDNSVVAWRSASLLPAAGANGWWPSGVDDEGRVYRLRSRSTLENVSDRYGLTGENVTTALPLGGALVAFVLERSIAVADGTMVVRYDVEGTSGASGAAGRVAVIAPGGKVLVLDVAAKTLTAWSVPGAVTTAISADGEVVVATSQTIHIATQEGAPVVYRAATANLHGLAMSGGTRLWFGEGTRLGKVEGHGIALGNPDTIAADAELTGSPAGGIWTRSEGKLARFEIPASGDEGVWQSTVRPIYAHTCSACHNRGGTAGIDLSTYDAWAMRRSRVYDRVVVRKDMPQGGTLPETDIAAIGAWAMSN